MSDSLPNSELMMLASQIYVRLRRCNGRIVDAVYMVKNEAYAREILELAAQQPDPELQSLASRYEGWLEPEMPVLAAPAVPSEDPRLAEARAAAIEAMMMMTMPPTPLKAVPKAAPVAAAPSSRTPTPLPKAPVQPPEPTHVPTEEEVAQHYIGALR